MKTELAQVRLRRGTTEQTCWVDKPVKCGDHVTLRNSDDPTWLWEVTEVYGGTPPERGWTVGGL